MSVNVELVVSPFCMAARDNKTVGKVCRKLGVDYRLINIWDVDDDLKGVPDHVALLIGEYRSGKRPGNLYSNVFVNGKRVLLDRWPDHLNEVSSLIECALSGESE
jgi:hypothetical protein